MDNLGNLNICLIFSSSESLDEVEQKPDFASAWFRILLQEWLQKWPHDSKLWPTAPYNVLVQTDQYLSNHSRQCPLLPFSIVGFRFFRMDFTTNAADHLHFLTIHLPPWSYLCCLIRASSSQNVLVYLLSANKDSTSIAYHSQRPAWVCLNKVIKSFPKSNAFCCYKVTND